jgi:hypothetical protein
VGAIVVLLSCGCLSVRVPEAGDPVRLETGERLVCGRVRLFDRGTEFDPWTVRLGEILAEEPVVRFALFQVESGRKRPNVPVARQGRFEWILPAGTYLIYHTPTVTPPFNEPLAAFQIQRGSDPVDLGELLINVSVDRPLSRDVATYTLLSVEARPSTPETALDLARCHPGTGTVQTGALVVDPELGGLFANWSREACARILARHGLDISGLTSK